MVANKSDEISRLIKSSFFVLSLIYSLLMLTIVLTYQSFFFFIPKFSNGNAFVASTQVLSIFGWVALMLLPPVILKSKNEWSRNRAKFFLLVIGLWPISILLVTITTYFHWHFWNYKYLVTSPIFIFLDAVIPISYLVMWLVLGSSENRKFTIDLSGLKN